MEFDPTLISKEKKEKKNHLGVIDIYKKKSSICDFVRHLVAITIQRYVIKKHI